MLTLLNNILKRSILIIFNICFLIDAKSEINIELKKRIIEEIEEIEENIRREKHKKRYFFEKSALRKTYSYFKNEKVKKINQISTDAAYTVFDYSYYFIKNIIYIKRKKIEFDKEVDIHSLPSNFNEGKISINEYYIQNGKIINLIENGILIKNEKKIRIKQKYITKKLEQFLFLSKYLNKPNYREYEGGKWGFLDIFPLCGSEKAIKLTYTYNRPFFIEVIDSNWERIYEREEIPKDGKETTITRIVPLPKDGKFDLDSIKISITSLTPGSKWRLKVEFEE